MLLGVDRFVSKVCVVFFFKQKTAYELRISDWSSDVCSSDLIMVLSVPPLRGLNRATKSRCCRSAQSPKGWSRHHVLGAHLCVFCVLCGPKALRFARRVHGPYAVPATETGGLQ